MRKYRVVPVTATDDMDAAHFAAHAKAQAFFAEPSEVWTAMLAAAPPEGDEVVAEMAEALGDILAGWRYIREHHGDLYGVGWDRAEKAADAALSRYRETFGNER